MSKPLKTNECGDLFQTAFEALNKQADPENFDPANAKKLFKQLASVVSGGEKGAGVRALDKWRNMSVLNKAFDIVNEFRVGAMLSGFKTQIISPISAAGTMYFRALETYLGAQLQVVFLKGDALKDARYIRSAAGEELKQMTRTLFNFKATMGAYKQMGEHPFTGLSQLEAQNVTSSASMAALSRTIDGKEGLLTNALQVLGHISTFSGQTLTRGDTTMKLVAGSSRFYSDQVYRQLKAGRSLSEATQLAHDHTTALLELKGSAKQKLMLAKELMDEGQSMPPELQEQMLRLGIKDNKDIDRVIDDLNLARENSESVTFTTALDKPTNTIEKLGRIAQKGHKEIPAVRMFLPFVRTPTNIASETWERTVGNMLGAAEAPFRMLQKRLRKGDGDELGEAWSNMQKKMESPDPRVRSEALGRMAAAVTTMGAVWSVLSEDDGSGLPSMTGSGPKDAGIIKSWKMSGWQPRSIRVGDSYISYDRFDPFAGALLGFVADIRDTMALTSDDGTIGEEASAMVLGLTVALANNITSKTWMKGARDLIDLSTGRVEKAEFAYQSVASSFVPSIVNDLSRLSGGEGPEKRVQGSRRLARGYEGSSPWFVQYR